MATKTNTEINGRNYFRISRTIDGKRKYFYGTSKGNAEEKYKLFLEERAERMYRDRAKASSATFHERAQEYIENVLSTSGRYSTGTKKRYESSYRTHIMGSGIDRMVLQQVRASDVQTFYNGLDVSESTMKGVHKFMSAFYKWVQLNNYADNVLTAVELPKKRSTKRHEGIVVWSEEEVRDILRNADALQSPSAPFRQTFMVYVLLYTGMRIGEVVSLRYSDFENGMINVERQCYMGEIKEPKYGSKRQIPVHPDLVTAFDRHRAWHEEEMRRNGYTTDYVFTTSSGRLYDPVNVRRALRRFYKANGIPYKHVHAYRSTFCTQLCRCGVPLEVASALLGHKSLEVTAAHYALVRKDSKVEAITSLHW